MPHTLNKPRPEPICGMDTWMPAPARIIDVHEENFNTRTLTTQFVDAEIANMYRFAPGQFNMLYVPGVGEAAFSVSSDPARSGQVEHTIRRIGSVTRGLWRLDEGGLLGIRGAFGRGWPMEEMGGRDVVIVAGGIGIAPLRPVVYALLQQPDYCRRLMLLYGCRTPEDRVYARELEAWEQSDAIEVLVTVDNATGEWAGPVGVVTDLLRRIKVAARETIVLVCGPKVLNRAAAWSFLQLHVPPDRVFVNLERNMNCGFARCGHCQYGGHFVCSDGPVFRFSDIANIFAKEDV
ncbi:MAG: FAD/NAD(P)-binding protein [Planctomycetota bacterium]